LKKTGVVRVKTATDYQKLRLPTNASRIQGSINSCYSI
jgi:hypothetical protein